MMESKQEFTKRDHRLAVTAQTLYLANISVLPIIAFLLLIPIYLINKNAMHPLALQHQRQAILANVASGVLLVIVSGLILAFGSFDSPYTWIVLIIYFICIHSALILYGVFALIKAIVDEPYAYPLIGKLWTQPSEFAGSAL
ncbi:MAG: hypothetical protein OQK04_14130 [Kangiellaceae bacterium]|nr:hypothetical protein [Kangiellaceae bacterium]MCW8999842.1 hypothetical protein [Kangiellaceae bacterium]